MIGIEGACTGDTCLRQFLAMAAPEPFGLAVPVVSGIVVGLLQSGTVFKFLSERLP